MKKLNCQKELFSIPDDIHYLNCGTQGPFLKSVEALGIESLKRKSHPYVIGVDDYFDPVEKLKVAFAKLVHVSNPQRIALIPSVSYGISTIAKNVKIEAGQSILIVDGQFPSNYYPWKQLADKNQAVIKTVEAPPLSKGRGARWNEMILEAIDNRTRVVAIGNIHWADGTIFDLQAIGAKAKSVGAYFIVDGSQTVGAMPTNIEELQPDALFNVGYKWLLGSHGNSFAYFGPKFDNGLPLEENWINRADSRNFAGLVNYTNDYREAANRYNVGQTSNFITTPMMTRSIEQLLEFGVENIQAYCAELVREPIQRLRQLGCFIEEDDYRANHLFGAYLSEQMDIQRLKEEMQAAKVFVSFRGNAVRITPNVYNDAEDLNALVEAFEKVASQIA